MFGELYIKVFIPMYKPLKIETCKKCEKGLAEPNELIRFTSVILKEQVC